MSSPRQFAILGSDANVVRIAEASIEAGHTIVWIGDVRPEDREALARLVPSVAPVNQWEALLDPSVADGIIVGAGMATESDATDRVKRLAAIGRPLLVVHPWALAVLPYFEVDMARQEGKGPLLHFASPQAPAGVAMIVEWIKTGHPDIGTIHNINWVRQTDQLGHDGILRGLARDIAILDQLFPEIHKVTGTGPGDSDASFARLSVQLTAPAIPPIHWNASPCEQGDAGGAQVSLTGQHGSLTISIADNNAPWTVSRLPEEEPIGSIETNNSATEVVRTFAAAITDDQRGETATQYSWDTAIHTMEIVDSILLSTEKGKTVEVFHQTLTEDLAFRGMMSAFGCGLIMLLLLAFVVAGIVGDLMGIPLGGLLPFGTLSVLFIFLLLQLVPSTARAGSSSR